MAQQAGANLLLNLAQVIGVQLIPLQQQGNQLQQGLNNVNAQLVQIQQQGNQLQQGLNNVNAQLAQMLQNQQNMANQLNAIQQQVGGTVAQRIANGRSLNRLVGFTSPLTPLPNLAGIIPPAWPVDLSKADLVRLPSATLIALLNFYGLPLNGNVVAKRERLMIYICGN